MIKLRAGMIDQIKQGTVIKVCPAAQWNIKRLRL